MLLSEYLNISELEDMINLGYIQVCEHHEFKGVKLFNYTKECQYKGIWNDTTMKCRGLIIDNYNNIIAKPFVKFFNYEEYEDKSIIPNDLNFEVFEKLDGSLGIMYWYEDKPYIATRGSFSSEQAVHATNILHTKYSNIFHKLDRDLTYLFEIIYPEDLKVVSYKGIDDIFLIGVLSNTNNTERDIEEFKDIFNVTKKYDGVNDWKTIRNMFSGKNREGFVIKFDDGFRLKLKYEEYFKLHSLKSGFTDKKIFELLVNNDMEILNNAIKLFDEENQIYFNNIINNYKTLYNNILEECIKDYKDDFETQKEAALYFLTCKYPAVLFNMRKGTNISISIWKYVSQQIKFKNNEDN